MQENLSLKHIYRAAKDAQITKSPLILMLHGFGSNENDLYSFANELPKSCVIISVQAPYAMGFGGYSWYNLEFKANGDKVSDIPQALSSLQTLNNFIDECIKHYPIDSEKIYLLGFSQGTILSLALAANYPKKVKGIIGLSGYFNRELLLEKLDASALKHIGFFISHGIYDDVIPVNAARATRALLENENLEVAYHEYPAAHGVSPENFRDMKLWLEEALR